jgi:hypothetical protein
MPNSIDCEALAATSVTLTLSGQALKVLNNALCIYSQYEPNICPGCIDEIKHVGAQVAGALHSCIEQVAAQEEA